MRSNRMRKVCLTAKQLCVELTGMTTAGVTSLEEVAGKEGHSSVHEAIFVHGLSFIHSVGQELD